MLLIDGLKISGTISNVEFQGELSLENGNWFVLQNSIAGAIPNDKKGYRYGWGISNPENFGMKEFDEEFLKTMFSLVIREIEDMNREKVSLSNAKSGLKVIATHGESSRTLIEGVLSVDSDGDWYLCNNEVQDIDPLAFGIETYGRKFAIYLGSMSEEDLKKVKIGEIQKR